MLSDMDDWKTVDYIVFFGLLVPVELALVLKAILLLYFHKATVKSFLVSMFASHRRVVSNNIVEIDTTTTIEAINVEAIIVEAINVDGVSS